MRAKTETSAALLCAVLLVGISRESCSAADGPASSVATGELSAQEIVSRVRRAYASLSTYRDSGWTVQQWKGDSWTNRFSELLGTRTCYRIEVVTAPHPFSQTNQYWSDGLVNSSQHAGGAVLNSADLHGNLIDVAHDTAMPAIYFNLSWANLFVSLGLGPEQELVRKSDETLDNVPCYVVARITARNPNTIWVGKTDFLIRRCQTNNRIEHHENISTNEILQRQDYVPPAFRLKNPLEPTSLTP